MLGGPGLEGGLRSGGDGPGEPPGDDERYISTGHCRISSWLQQVRTGCVFGVRGIVLQKQLVLYLSV